MNGESLAFMAATERSALIDIDDPNVENIRAACIPSTMPFDLTGNPAISLPCGFDAGRNAIGEPTDRLPSKNERQLTVAALLERVRPWDDPKPVA